ncbi:MAG: CoA-binding protein, partial [Actinomycetota bacterium]|nr:CoA-binding protein [Actinomycetota bacterium]
MESRKLRPNNLEKLFSPASIAIVGASESRHYSKSLIGNLRQQGFAASKIFPINPKYETISGLRCFASLEELEEAPDAVAVLVGHDQVAGVIESAGKMGVGAALVIADGYADESEQGRLA